MQEDGAAAEAVGEHQPDLGALREDEAREQDVGGQPGGGEEERREHDRHLPEAVDVFVQGGVRRLVRLREGVDGAVGERDGAQRRIHARPVGALLVREDRLPDGSAGRQAVQQRLGDEEHAEVVLRGQHLLAAGGRPDVLGGGRLAAHDERLPAAGRAQV